MGGDGGVGKGLRVYAAAAAGGGGGRRRRRGDYLLMSCVELSGGSTFVLLAGGIWLLARSLHINFLPLSSHNVVVVLISYVH